MIKRQNAKFLIIFLTFFTIFAILAISAIIVLQGIWDFIGINNTNKININNTTCSIAYVNVKYGNYMTNKQIFITLISISLAFIFTGTILGFIIMFLCSYFLSSNKKPFDLLITVTQYKIYFLVILNSITLSCLIAHFGYFLSFLLQISIANCNESSDLNNQNIVISSLSGFALFMMFLVWILLLRMNNYIQQYLTQNQKDNKFQKAKTKQTQKPLITDIQMQQKAYLAQARKQLQDKQKSRYTSLNKYIEGPNVNDNRKSLNHQNYNYILHQVERQQKIQKQRQNNYLRNPLLDKGSNSNSPISTNKNIKNQMYYGNFRELNQEKKNPEKQGILVYHKPRYQTPQKNYYQEQIYRKIKLYDQNQLHNDNFKRTQQPSYMRQPALKNKNYGQSENYNKQRQNPAFYQNSRQDYLKQQPNLSISKRRNDYSEHSPIQRQYNRSSPRNQSPLRKKYYTDDHYTPVSKIQKNSDNKNKLSSEKPRNGMLMGYIREKYIQ